MEDPMTNDETTRDVRMTEEDLETTLHDLFDMFNGDEPGFEFMNDDEVTVTVNDVQTFRQAGVLTNNKGLVLLMSDGTEFQLTLVRSR
jgi:hypothetical protein